MSVDESEPRRKARGDDVGRAWEINEENDDRSDHENGGKEDEGRAWHINENTSGD